MIIPDRQDKVELHLASSEDEIVDDQSLNQDLNSSGRLNTRNSVGLKYASMVTSPHRLHASSRNRLKSQSKPKKQKTSIQSPDL